LTTFPDDVDTTAMASNLPISNHIQHVIQKAYDALLPGGETGHMTTARRPAITPASG
jgi:hypothetical protein